MYPCCPQFTYYKKVTHVIFDLDGTLMDTEKCYDEVIEILVKEYGAPEIEYNEDVMMRTKGSNTTDTLNFLIRRFKMNIKLEDLRYEFITRADDLIIDADLMPGAEELVEHLHAHNIPMAVATSSDFAAVEVKRKKNERIFGLFHHVVAGGDDPEVKRGKPFPDIFLVAGARFDDKPLPDKCLVIEDAANGVLAALRAGMQCVMIPAPYVPYHIWKKATLRLNSMSDMPLILFGLPPLIPLDDAVTKVPATYKEPGLDSPNNPEEKVGTDKLGTNENEGTDKTQGADAISGTDENQVDDEIQATNETEVANVEQTTDKTDEAVEEEETAEEEEPAEEEDEA